MKLSVKQTALLLRFGEEENIAHTRWVLTNNMSRAGGDPNPRSYTALRDRRLIIKTLEQITIADGKRVTTIHYRITDKGKRALKDL
tara:strand:- start:502 stop:759 length:258 start_codon:yes stop_codon:yes gene_type:complete